MISSSKKSLTAINTEHKVIEGSVGELKKEVKALSFVRPLSVAVEQIESQITRLESMGEKKYNIDTVLGDIDILVRDINSIYLIPTNMLEELDSSHYELCANKDRCSSIENLTNSIEDIGISLEKLGSLLSYVDTLKLVNGYDELYVLKTDFDSISRLVLQVKKLAEAIISEHMEVNTLEKEEKKTKEEYRSCLEKESVCPYCFQPIDGKILERVIHEI